MTKSCWASSIFLLLTACAPEEPEVRTGVFELNGARVELSYVVDEVTGDWLHDDIILGNEDDPFEPRIVAVSRGRLWPNGLIPYELDPALPGWMRGNINTAIQTWTTQTNGRIRFAHRNGETDYVLFRWEPDANVCSAHIGQRGAQQHITLAAQCDVGTVMHEIGHAIGLWHEHQRPGRARDINIHWNRIEEGRQHNFQEIGDATYVFGDSIDFESIMMYSSWAFAQTENDFPLGPTITKKNGDTWRRADTISPTDALHVRWLYNDSVACEMFLESCPVHPEQAQRWFRDQAGSQSRDRCMNRPREWLEACASPPANFAFSHFYWKQDRLDQTVSHAPGCEISIPSCPRQRTYEGLRVDPLGSANVDQCRARVQAWHSWCQAPQNTSFWGTYYDWNVGGLYSSYP